MSDAPVNPSPAEIDARRAILALLSSPDVRANLGQRLYETLEKLDPSDAVSWQIADGLERHRFEFAAVEVVQAFLDLAHSRLSDHNVINRLGKLGE